MMHFGKKDLNVLELKGLTKMCLHHISCRFLSDIPVVSLSLFQGELEKLNQSTDDINRCETELEVSVFFVSLCRGVCAGYL